MVALSRRALLGAGAVAALAAAGCGERAPAAPAGDDRALLAGLLAVEQALVSAWEAAAALPGADGRTARDVLDRERAHVRSLEHALAAAPGHVAGEAPRDVADAAQRMRLCAHARDAKGALDAALTLESAAADAYLRVLARLLDPGHRSLATALFAAEAQHAAVVRLALGGDPLPDAFAGTLRT